ncbi:hypothetical protein M8C21_027509 [Ambrosia artemisiifolia]|uniref:Uncharacterized protein n=1 Tax=Ambrosia artemisiifolia TaxID=4212 RepID=A0AAD5GQS4_AMBAR|nr:hypothetical protein M8C21_027509 [Ambrosia artemisiifolia]
MSSLTNVSRSYPALPLCSFKCKSSVYPTLVNMKGVLIATDVRKNCVIKATSSPTPSANMEGAKDEEKSDVYSTNMTEAMGAVLTYRHELGMNYNFIRPDLIVGSCLQTSADVDKLRSIKVKTIFCLQQDSDLDVDISAIREYASTFDDIQHIRAEIRDFDGTDLRLRLPAVVSKLHKAVNRNGGVTYIHCTAGLGRAPATALAYMFWVQGYKLNNALSLLLRIPLTYEEKHGSWILHRELLKEKENADFNVRGVMVVDKDPESISAALWKRLAADDFDLTTNEREIIKQFLDEYPDDE